MVHTLPPWTTKYRMVTVFGQIDSGELAARLGSINTFDRRGNVVFMEDFEGTTLKWSESHTGSNPECYLTNTRSCHGDQSLYLYTGNMSGDITSLKRHFPLPVQSKLGFELSFSPIVTNFRYQITVTLRDGTTVSEGLLRYDNKTEKIQIETDTSVDIATGIDVTKLYNSWCTMKLVVDYATNKYVRVIFNNKQYDVSKYSMTTTSDTTTPRLYVRLSAIVQENFNRSTYFDSFIITQNEE